MNDAIANPTNQLRFSKQRLAALPPPANRVAYYYDTEVRGLAISVGKSGRKSFLLYRKIAGKPRRLPIGDFPELSVEEARSSAEKLNAEISRGADPSTPVRRSPIFRDVFQDYL